MGRGYDIALYREVLRSLRRARPEIALSTDLIVGFPGESDADFDQTLELVEETRFASIFAFKYSPRPGTAAPKLPDPVAREIADDRLQRVLALQHGIQRELNEALVGRVHEVLVTGWGREPGTQVGRTSCHRVVHFTPDGSQPTPLGHLTTVRLSVFDNSNAQNRRIGTREALRADLIPGGDTSPVLGGPDQYYDPTQFVNSQIGFFGNLGRNTLISPGLATVDFSVFKDFQISEGSNLQFRTETFNLFNRANFATPDMTPFSSSSTPDNLRRDNGAGSITRTRTPGRQIQFGLRFTF